MTCPSTQVYHDDAFVWEVSAWTVVGFIAIAARFVVRLRIRGWKNLQGDDFMAIVVLSCFLLCTVTTLSTYYWGSNTDYTEEQLRAFSDCQIARIVASSKLQLVAWYAYTALIWGLKAMVLFFLHRMSFGLHQHRLMKALAIACVLTYTAVILTIFCGCRPIHLNWATVPYPPVQCSQRIQNLYVTTILNVITDAAILAIPLPLLWQMRVPIRRKIALTLLLCSGFFIIMAAIISIVFTLTMPGSTLNVNLWGTREEIAGILAVNAPILKSIFSRNFWHRNFEPARTSSAPTPSPRRPRPPPRLQQVAAMPPVSEEIKKLGVFTSIKSWIGKSTNTAPTDGRHDSGAALSQTNVPQVKLGILSSVRSWVSRSQVTNMSGISMDAGIDYAVATPHALRRHAQLGTSPQSRSWLTRSTNENDILPPVSGLEYGEPRFRADPFKTSRPQDLEAAWESTARDFAAMTEIDRVLPQPLLPEPTYSPARSMSHDTWNVGKSSKHPPHLCRISDTT